MVSFEGVCISVTALNEVVRMKDGEVCDVSKQLGIPAACLAVKISMDASLVSHKCPHSVNPVVFVVALKTQTPHLPSSDTAGVVRCWSL